MIRAWVNRQFIGKRVGADLIRSTISPLFPYFFPVYGVSTLRPHSKDPRVALHIHGFLLDELLARICQREEHGTWSFITG